MTTIGISCSLFLWAVGKRCQLDMDVEDDGQKLEQGLKTILYGNTLSRRHEIARLGRMMRGCRFQTGLE